MAMRRTDKIDFKDIEYLRKAMDIPPHEWQEMHKATQDMENSSVELTTYFDGLIAVLNKIVDSEMQSRHDVGDKKSYQHKPLMVEVANAIEKMAGMTAAELRQHASMGPLVMPIEADPNAPTAVRKRVTGGESEEQVVKDTASLIKSIGERAVRTYRRNSVTLD